MHKEIDQTDRHDAVRNTNSSAHKIMNNEASTDLTTANGGTFTSSSASLSSESRYR